MSRIAYYTNESYYDASKGGYVVAEVTENEAGYRTLSGGFSDVMAAKARADELNANVGISWDDVLDIVASSIRQGSISPPKLRGLK
jgi:hypothetical protein